MKIDLHMDTTMFAPTTLLACVMGTNIDPIYMHIVLVSKKYYLYGLISIKAMLYELWDI